MSGLSIQITAGATAGQSSVSVHGSLQHIITDAERRTFNIANDTDLKHAVNKYFGHTPDDVFLHSSTPWGDLYKTYNWAQVETVLVAKSAQVTGFTTRPSILATKVLRNDFDKEVTLSAKISESVAQTVSTTWSNSNTVSFSQAVEYGVGFLGTGVKGTTTFGFQHTWGQDNTSSKQITVGSETGVTVPVGPHEAAEVELSASSGAMHVRIVYEAYVTGSVAVNYGHPYNGHHFYSLDAGAVVKAAGSSNNVQIVEDIEVGFTSNANVTVKNAQTKAAMSFHQAIHAP